MKWLNGYRIRLVLVGFIATIVLSCLELSNGATIAVGPEAGCDFDTLQAGIDAASDGDMVLVGPGEYIVTEPITFRGKAITVKSEAGPDETTIRMGTPTDPKRGSVVVFENNETAASVLDGFTITGGRGVWFLSVNTSGAGGILFNASGTVKNCIIIQNTATYGGGVICWDNSLAILSNCAIVKNSAGMVEGSGGGVLCGQNSSATLTNCTIVENSAGMGGGGVNCSANSSMTMTGCTILENSTVRHGAGGVFCEGNSSLTITNCNIIENSASNECGGILCWENSLATVTNSIVWGNTAPQGDEVRARDGGTISISYSDVAGGQTAAVIDNISTINWGEGNIDADPCFADPDEDDYHLKSQAGRWDPNNQTWVQDDVTSPCIDAGDPDSDWTAELWPHGIRANMGAYGSTLHASRSLSDAGSIADVNRDGIVDPIDMYIMVDHWGTDEPYCDIATAPFGDGIVDVQDLIVLAEHLFEDVSDPTLVAHWPLDEAQGIIAYDNAADYDGTLIGVPVWQPDGGMMAGALQFDGIDDYVSTDPILNPADGPFSVFAWIKGGAPGQAIVSQQGVANWLAADTEGNLMTELKATGRSVGHLRSETVITDGQWHRIGLVWDGSNRTLCVDGVVVAEDTQPGLEGSQMGLYISVDKNYTAGTFFSGLIDDIRIYNRAVHP